MATRFEDLIIWQQAEEIALSIYKSCADMKDWGFKDQIQRASVSIMNNIAEGYEKPTNKDKVRFFAIAKGSCAEVRSMLHLGLKLGYFDEQLYQELTTKAYGLNKMIYSFTQKLT